MASRFMANRPISVSMAMPSITIPWPSFWKSQTTSSRLKGICWRASKATMSLIRFSSTGGSFTKRTSPLLPGTAMARWSPFQLFRFRKVSSASRMSASLSASGWLRILACSM